MIARALLVLLAVPALALTAGGCGRDSGSARSLLDEAARHPARSADLSVAFRARLEGARQLQGPLRLTISGPYRSNGPRALPDMDLRVHVEAAGTRIYFGLVTVRDNAFVRYGGTAYEVGQGTIRRYTRQSVKGGPQSLRSLGVDASNWIEDPTLESGAATDQVSGDIDVRRLLGDLNRLLRRLGTSARLPAGGKIPQIPPRTVEQIDEAVDEAKLDVEVGKDGILRHSGLRVRFELPDELRSRAKGLEGGELSFRSDQLHVNGNQRVTPPVGARPLSELLGGFGMGPALPG